MKVAFTGKGGVGKTTVASLFIRLLAQDKRRVLAVDCDPDSNLAGALGFPKTSEIVPISKMKEFIHDRMEIEDDSAPAFYKLNPKIDDIPQKFIKKVDGIELIVMGTVEKGGAGCVCPESSFMRSLLSELVLRYGEDIVMDMDPGIEHLGRQTAKVVDEFIIVVEPSIKSVETAQKIIRLSQDIGVKNAFIVGNKVKDAKDKNFIESNFENKIILGLVPLSPEILQLDKEAVCQIKDEKIIDEIKKLKARLYKEEEHARK